MIRKLFFVTESAEIQAETERKPMSDARFKALLRLGYVAIGAAVGIVSLITAGPIAMFGILVVSVVAVLAVVD